MWKWHVVTLMSEMLLAKVLWRSKSFEPGRTPEAKGLMLASETRWAPFLKTRAELILAVWIQFHEGQCGNPSTTAKTKTLQLNFQLETCFLESLLILLTSPCCAIVCGPGDIFCRTHTFGSLVLKICILDGGWAQHSFVDNKSSDLACPKTCRRQKRFIGYLYDS